MRTSPNHDASVPRSSPNPLLPRGVSRWALLSLAGLMVGSAAVILVSGKGMVPLFDEWFFIIVRDGFTLDSLLLPHFGHLLVVEVLLYKSALALGGFGALWALRVLMVLLFLLSAAGLFVLARRRTSDFTAVVIAGLFLMCFVPSDVLIWSFQVGWQVAICALVWLVVLLDSGQRRWDPLVSLLILAALGSGGIGLLTLVVATVMLAFDAERWRRCWVVLGPTLLYLIWILAYSPTEKTPLRIESLSELPHYAFEIAGKSIGAVFGLDSDIGKWLLLPFLLVVGYHLISRRRVTPLMLAALTGLAVWFVLLTLSRGGWVDPTRVTFVFPTVLLFLMIGIDLSSGRSIPKYMFPVALLTLVLIGVSNYSALVDYQNYWRNFSADMKGRLGAVRLVEPARQSTALLGWIPFPGEVQEYFRAERLYGRIGLSPEQLARADVIEAASADGLLIQAKSAQWEQVPRRAITCRLAPSGRTELPVRPGQPIFVRSDQRISLYLHRFWKGTLPTPPTTLPPSRYYRISVLPDPSDAVWMAQLGSPGNLRVCTGPSR